MLQVDAEPIHPFATANGTDIDAMPSSCLMAGHINPGTVLARAEGLPGLAGSREPEVGSDLLLQLPSAPELRGFEASQLVAKSRQLP